MRRFLATQTQKNAWLTLAVAAACAVLVPNSARAGDRLLATWGVTQVEGAGGGGLTPWATIAGSGSSNQTGGSAFVTHSRTNDGYDLKVAGAAVGIRDRVELSMARWSFKLSDVVPDKSIEMSSLGVKVKVIGDAVYDQDSWLPQISVGAQYKSNDDKGLVNSFGADNSDVDVYASATKLWLGAAGGYNVLANLTLRLTRANQFGLVGFGGAGHDKRKLMAEGSVGVMLRDDLVLGTEYRQKPNNLEDTAAILKEEAAWDVFVAWFPTRLISLTAAWLNLGNIVSKPDQQGLYLSGQVTF
ncbi:DUF3034 family protein [Aquabacterium sp. CECT 9606]|uniref:DUF3034 family protein n=1 Tax=Aquabacterium sp. CECT 9606 TaxID=2845822 RepID=UPI001E5FF800|nr:DUF3034 family protein [Aquabacterium sp. CECT 9606]CAH0350046.1 hypothetical protein AQB9606_01377 [Aquabacterium sp. CECT 9606]